MRPSTNLAGRNTLPCPGCKVKQIGKRLKSIFDPRQKICTACAQYEASEINHDRALTKVGKGF